MSEIFIDFASYYGSYFIVPFFLFIAFLFFRSKIKFNFLFFSIFLILGLSLFYIRFVEPKILLVKQENVDLKGLENTEIKVAVFSDLHTGFFKNSVSLKRIVEKINKEKTDAIFILGDFVHCADVGSLEVDLKELKNFSAPVFAILGNHDIGRPGIDLSFELKNVLKNLGVEVLDNEKKEIILKEKKFNLVGLADLWGGKTDFNLLNNLNDNLTIVLVHNPDAVYKFLKIDKNILVLSGHTHGGQMKIPFIYHNAIPTENDFIRGFYDILSIKVFVSSGIGVVGLPFRFFAFPEAIILNLR